jgi:hypothetical protein
MEGVKIATPLNDPLCPITNDQQFLRSLGDEQGDKAAFIKLMR